MALSHSQQWVCYLFVVRPRRSRGRSRTLLDQPAKWWYARIGNLCVFTSLTLSTVNSPSLNDVNNFSYFQKRIRAPTSTQDSNYSCIVPNCSSACSLRRNRVFLLILFLLPWLQFVLCSRCAHPYLFHVHVSRLQRQSDLTHNAANELPQSADDYALAWPLGGLSARVERAIRLLEQKRTDMEEKGVCREQLGSIQRSLVQMKGRLDLLRKVKETLWEGLRKVKQVFFRA